MLVLLQMIKIAQSNNQVGALKKHVDELYLELQEGMIDSIEMAETLESLIGVELEPRQIERLAEVLSNGSYKSAFNVMSA